MNGADTEAVGLNSPEVMKHMVYLSWTVLLWQEHNGGADDTIKRQPGLPFDYHSHTQPSNNTVN